MVEIRLWAPLATRAEAHVVGRPGEPVPEPRATERVIEMPRVDAEHFATELPVGTDYLLSVDGGEPRPDPRSRFQPYGSTDRRVVGLDFDWTDADWPGIDPLGRVFYELHVGTFTPAGTLDSAIERLPYLVELGVDIVELMPLAPFRDAAAGATTA